MDDVAVDAGLRAVCVGPGGGDATSATGDDPPAEAGAEPLMATLPAWGLWLIEKERAAWLADVVAIWHEDCRRAWERSG